MTEEFIKIKTKRINFYTNYKQVKIKKNDLKLYEYEEFIKSIIEPFGFIYKITNLCNNKVYIGQTIQNPFNRFNAHIVNNKNKNLNSKLQRAINKYNKYNFEFNVIRDCKNQEDLNNSEEFFIKLFDSTNNNNGYNICRSVWVKNNVMKGTSLYNLWVNKWGKEKADILIEEFKEKQRIIAKNSYKTKNFTFTGMKHSEKSKNKLKKDRLGSKNPMYGKSPYSVWVEKYGQEEADRLQKICLDKRKETRRKNINK